jgi:hypothetical protein
MLQMHGVSCCVSCSMFVASKGCIHHVADAFMEYLAVFRVLCLLLARVAYIMWQMHSWSILLRFMHIDVHL